MTKKYNLSLMMSYAHYLRRKYNMTMSAALKSVWRQTKEAPSGRLIIGQKDALQMAFQKKYPTGTLNIHQFWRGASVQFTAGGKWYTYKNYGWQQKLGIAA